MNYGKHVSKIQTPQTEPIPGKDMEENNAGGYSFTLDIWKRLERFLILGAEGNTYYCSEKSMVKANASVINECLKEAPIKTVRIIEQISESGRAPKNSPAIFALALASVSESEASRSRALLALPKVCRTGTHLFEFLEARKQMGGKWGRGMRNAVYYWYSSMTPSRMAYQAIKYQQRNGWSHADALRLAHPKFSLPEQDFVAGFITEKVCFELGVWARKEPCVSEPAGKKLTTWVPHHKVELPKDLRILEGFARMRGAADPKIAAGLIQEYKLPWEAVPSELLGKAEVWEALLPGLPMTATLRNLGRMSANGLLTQGSEAQRIVIEKLSNLEALKGARIHPIGVLSALRTYAGGHGVRGKLTWVPVQKVVDVLDDAFYASFQNIQPTNKRILLALDVSGSMDNGDIAGVPGLTPREAAAAMAMAIARTEPNYEMVAFSHELVNPKISPKMRLDTVVGTMRAIPMGGTDCSLPMLWAAGKNCPDERSFGWRTPRQEKLTTVRAPIRFDCFVTLTDSETWAGVVHPTQALGLYRKEVNPRAKMVVIGVTATEFTVGDPNDAGTLNVAGLTPRLLI